MATLEVLPPELLRISTEYRYDKVQKLEEENMQFRTIIDSSDNELKKVLKDLTDQANKSRIEADKANQKLNRLQERLDSEEKSITFFSVWSHSSRRCCRKKILPIHFVTSWMRWG